LLYETGKVNPGIAKTGLMTGEKLQQGCNLLMSFVTEQPKLLRYLFAALSLFPHLCLIVFALSSDFLLSSTSFPPLLHHVIRFLWRSVGRALKPK